MPYVLDHDKVHRPAKRRKVIHLDNMNRQDTSGVLPERLAGTEGRRTVEAVAQPIQPSLHAYQVSDREELIQCIKRGQNPTWIPKPNLRALHAEDEAQRAIQEVQVDKPPLKLDTNNMVEDPFFGSWTESKDSVPSSRSRSAFHRGDFCGSNEPCLTADVQPAQDCFSESPTSLLTTTPPSWPTMNFSSFIGRALSDPRVIPCQAMGVQGRRRAPSLGSSLSSSFVMRTPTSPLVHAISNSALDLETSEQARLGGGQDEDVKGRRRTLPPNSFHFYRISPVDSSTPPNFSRPFVGVRPQNPMPHRGHQSRRSLSSFTYHSTSTPQTPLPRERRSSLACELSPRNRLSMVGSFEESILRGRMSSPASKPFDFIAEVGVMGKGQCSTSLRCPAHVSIPFRAVFYQYPTSSDARSIADDAPSPYVGTIDLEQNLKPILLGTKSRRGNNGGEHDVSTSTDPRAPENTAIGRAITRDLQKQKRRSLSPRISLGGAYRVPKKGQLQIMIKNQHKSAIKLFLVPYDLEGMDAGTKTFVRQRSFSCGPIIEDAVGTQQQSPKLSDPLRDKHVLRYLIHLKFCCPARGRYYLHESVRVVFANRVPDGRETLQSEIQLPEPRYSAYRPAPQTKGLLQSPSDPSDEKAFLYGRSQLPTFFADERMEFSTQAVSSTSQEPSFLDHVSPVIPFHFARDKHGNCSDGSSPQTHSPTLQSVSSPDVMPKPTKILESQRPMSPVQGFLPSTSTRASPHPWINDSVSPNRSFSPVPVEPGDGLLSRQFKTLNDTNLDKCVKEDTSITTHAREPSDGPENELPALSPRTIIIDEPSQPNTR